MTDKERDYDIQDLIQKISLDFKSYALGKPQKPTKEEANAWRAGYTTGFNRGFKKGKNKE